MKVTKMYCDRCGKEFEKWNHKHVKLMGIAELVYDDGDPYLDSPKDLCESCYTELEKWWFSVKNKESEIWYGDNN